MSTIITPSPLPEGLNGPLHPYVALLEAFLKEEGRLDKLDAAVEGAVDEGISELEDWKISTGEQFFQYASRLLDKWIPSEIQDGTFVYQVITVFYYIFDQAELNDLQTKIVPQSIDQHGLPILTPLSQWIVGYANLMGEWLDQPRSITPDSYQSFRDAKKYRIGDYRIPIPGDPVGGFQSFNEFFCRHLKEGWPYPNVRHIEKLDDPNVVIFPADSVFDNHWGINDENLVSIKNLPWPIGALLHGCPGAYVDRFEGGTWCHAFLNTFDYHRQHAPVAGRILHASVIPGLCHLEVRKDTRDGKTVLKPHRSFQRTISNTADAPEAKPYAEDKAGYQFMQRRGCIIIDTGETNGLVAVLPIGMAQVSSINLSVKKDDHVDKGQEISWFEFGGSDIVLVFEKRAYARSFPAPRVNENDDATHHKLMGHHLCTIGPD